MLATMNHELQEVFKLWVQNYQLDLEHVLTVIHFHFIEPIHTLHLIFLAVVTIKWAIGVSANNFTPSSNNDSHLIQTQEKR